MYYPFFDLENIGVDTKIMILCQLELEILFKLDFNGGPFEKWPKSILRPNFCSGNITHIIPRSSHFRVFLGFLGFSNMTVYLYVLPSVIQPWHMTSLIEIRSSGSGISILFRRSLQSTAIQKTIHITEVCSDTRQRWNQRYNITSLQSTAIQNIVKLGLEYSRW